MDTHPPTPELERPPDWPAGWPFRFEKRPFVARRAMAVTTDRYASEVGVDVLRRGGNAVDASVAVAFALAVVNPEAGNIGGSGFMVLRMADGTAASLDYRSVAPGLATRDMFLDGAGDLGDRSVLGPLSAGVPGSVMGLWDAHRRFGTLEWADLVEPAIGLAEGFVVEERLASSYPAHIVAGLAASPASAAVFLPGGRPPQVGERLRQPDLARALERIRDRGADGFYLGETADLIVAAMERAGGVITRDDLATYTAVWRDPLRFRYRDHTVLAMPPSSSGGVALAEAAHIIETSAVGDLRWHCAEHVHLLAEAWRRAYADRNHYMADADFIDLPLETLLSRAYAEWRASDVSLHAATPSDAVPPGVAAYVADQGMGRARQEGTLRPGSPPSEGNHTTHYSIVDERGGATSVTTTLNTWYGSKMVVEGTGILLNNEMDDFTVKPGAPNHFDLIQGEGNVVEPGKRMLSAMTPTIVLDREERLLMVVGTSGGGTITTTVFQVLSNVVDHGMGIAEAVLAPRVHHQHRPDRIQYEPGGLSQQVVAALREMGHRVVERGDISGDVQAIQVMGDGTLHGQSDPRRGGTAAGY